MTLAYPFPDDVPVVMPEPPTFGASELAGPNYTVAGSHSDALSPWGIGFQCVLIPNPELESPTLPTVWGYGPDAPAAQSNAEQRLTDVRNGKARPVQYGRHWMVGPEDQIF